MCGIATHLRSTKRIYETIERKERRGTEIEYRSLDRAGNLVTVIGGLVVGTARDAKFRRPHYNINNRVLMDFTHCIGI